VKRLLAIISGLAMMPCFAQNIGIGTSSPASTNKLHVHDNVNPDVSIGLSNNLTTDAAFRGVRLRIINSDFDLVNQEITGTINLVTGFLRRLSVTANGNIGMGTVSPNSNAILELNATDKGLLLPRVADTNAIAGTKPNGLVIYSISDNKLYYYQGSKWLAVAAAAGSGNYWDLLGNTGTIDGTQFTGTTDDVAFNIRVNNQKAGRISNSAGSITSFGYQVLNVNAGIQNSGFGQQALLQNAGGNYNTAVGYTAMFSNTSGSSNTGMGTGSLNHNISGNFNTAHGYQSLYNNTSGNNTAIGAEALFINTTGYSNTAAGMRAMHNNASGHNNNSLGDSALYYIISGSNNTAAGSKALLNNGGNANTAFGSGTLTNAVNGNNNSAFGFNANMNTGNLSNATSIGAFARVDISNALVLGSINGINGATADAFVGIGTTAPLARLHIKHNSFPTPSLLIEETEDDYTRMEFRNINANSFWQINAKPQLLASGALMEFWNSSSGSASVPFYINGNGNATLAGTLTQNSDGRLKKNILPVKNALQKIIQINGYTYNWIDKNIDEALQLGVLAQELQKVLPALVKEDTKGILSVNYSGIIPVLIEAVKEQQKLIVKLAERLKMLEER
jgi:hypothetical protein